MSYQQSGGNKSDTENATCGARPSPDTSHSLDHPSNAFEDGTMSVQTFANLDPTLSIDQEFLDTCLMSDFEVDENYSLSHQDMRQDPNLLNGMVDDLSRFPIDPIAMVLDEEHTEHCGTSMLSEIPDANDNLLGSFMEDTNASSIATLQGATQHQSQAYEGNTSGLFSPPSVASPRHPTPMLQFSGNLDQGSADSYIRADPELNYVLHDHTEASIFALGGNHNLNEGPWSPEQLRGSSNSAFWQGTSELSLSTAIPISAIGAPSYDSSETGGLNPSTPGTSLDRRDAVAIDSEMTIQRLPSAEDYLSFRKPESIHDRRSASPTSVTSSICELCGKKYTGNYGKGNLNRHRRQHRDGIQCPCPVTNCRSHFKRSDALLKHLRRKHPESAARRKGS